MNVEAVLAAEAYHYPTDLLNLLIDTIPVLCRSKKDVVQFFRAAGAPVEFCSPWSSAVSSDPDSVRKHEIARTILNQLNAGENNLLLRARREIVKRVVEWSNFGICWESDRERAELCVRRVRELVNQKDAFTKINRERESAEEQLRQERRARLHDAERKRDERRAAKARLFAVFGETDPWKRGTLLEVALNEVFRAHDILLRESFVLRTESGQIREQIDGAIELQSHVYLVEVRWRESPSGAEEIARHLSRVQYRSGARGMFISVSEFTEPAAIAFREAHQQRVHLALLLIELVQALEAEQPLGDFLHQRAQKAILEKDPFAS